SPFFFDLYYLLLLAFVLPPYVSVMFGAFVACHMNIYKMCEKTPLDYEYLLGEGKVILRRRWGGLIIRVTVFAFILSALTNVPILLFSGEIGSLLNLVLALALTIVIFLFPHYMFHRMLEKSKDEMLLRVWKLQKEHGLTRLEEISGDSVDEQGLSAKLNLIFLVQYEWSLKVGSTWLVDLKAVVELLLVASIHVLFMEALSMFAQH
ncbi:MAG: hypothetical protein ACFFDP_10025, partial [Promethearchaeota archaeon]